jgi:4-amino-4-deoxychorismate lyase
MFVAEKMMMMTRTRTTTTVFTNSRSKRSERIIIKRLRFRRREKVEEDKEEVFDEIPVLSGERFLQLHREKSTPDDDDENCLQLAMYSSHVRAITTDSESFVMKVDDHGFHRGHAVFDTVSIDAETRTFQDLDYHLDRLQTSAEMAFLTFPKGLESLDSLARIVKETVSAAFEEKERRQRGRSISSSDCCSSMMQARFYLTAGVGGFSLSAKECAEGSNFYCVVIERTKTETTKALRARTTPIAVKNKPFSTIKSTNYLQNCMITTDAEMHGCDVGIWVANDGKVLEGPSANVAFVDDRGIFIAPKVDDVLDGVTMRRCFEFIEKGLLADVGVVECERRDCSFRELVLERRAKECMMIGSVVQCVPIEKWDDVDIGRDEGENGRNKVAVRLKEKDARGIRVS